jgi:hypothetical protein
MSNNEFELKKPNSANKIHPKNNLDQVPNLDTEKKADSNNEERDNWTGKLDFFLSALSYSVGLGNFF